MLRQAIAQLSTGACGRAFIPEALQAGHELTLYVRNLSKLSEDVKSDAKVHVVEGQLDDIDQLKSAIAKGAEVFLSFIGPSVPSNSMVSASTWPLNRD